MWPKNETAFSKAERHYQVASIPASFSEGTRYKSQHAVQLYWLRFPTILPSPSMQIPG